jgi:hypothetical protein
MKYYVVEAIATYHMKYLIAQPDDHQPEWCMDTVTCEEADDLVQNYLGEQILGFEEVDDAGILKHTKGSYVESWPLEQVKEVFTKVVQDD